jgi:hypothetical protein
VRIIWAVTAVIGALAVVVGLSGCTISGNKPSQPSASVAIAARPVPDGIVATGTLTSWNGKTTGSLQVSARRGNFTFVLSDLATDLTGPTIFALADTAVTITQCGENNLWQLGLTTRQGNVVAPTMSFDLPNEAGAFGDPSFFRTFLILQYPTSAADGTPAITRGCQQPIVALASIRWSMKPIYPRLALADHGAASGATGTAMTKDGELFSYTTATNDAWAAIAQRFGLTSAELLYLNPIRHPEAEPAIAYAGQILNLSQANRGDSESRRPGAQ